MAGGRGGEFSFLEVAPADRGIKMKMAEFLSLKVNPYTCILYIVINKLT